MLSLREATGSLYGAYRLARFDAGGMAFFDTSVDGFWRSFYAAAMVAPFYAVLLALRYSLEIDPPHPMRFFLLYADAYVISWLAFPVVMAGLSGIIGRQPQFTRYIVAYNWAAVLQNALYLPLAMLQASESLPRDAGNLFGLIVLVAVLVYIWFITRTALVVAATTAAGIVAVDFFLTLIIHGFIEGRL
ncbi:MAG: hypothetical protein QGF38_13145 [Rhodospirillales bacterium]|jgi:hypothetical protein|nr:hypothetical protein [Rhodospirillales bacterium]HJO97392.1 hypothetical protein [Rhodospirillales bacterium]